MAMAQTGAPVRVLMVCMGNICRSPTAHAVLRQRVAQAGLSERIAVQSAGTHAYHVGEPPDARSQAHARRRGIDMSDLRAQHLSAADCEVADHVLVMDEGNLQRTLAVCPPAHRHKVRLLTEHCSRYTARAVPDPYYGGEAGFEQVLDLIEDACDGLLQQLRAP
jgi:protein-tyrosine phosphatase